ncbi:SGNH/GDSL hydrolase family protein [Dyadobacter sp. CY312]|uniref:SGNH/GDSL hydrolase family protein n=1 Tax=Dyadobacter sp. CY312 TaxID=2907303 RepID=UPI001F174702|nr:SGNH/GDSL hydrolase family protein [Dyadobacter sp. CY312]MCE7039016.1 SGNH/GDSL hydrolase family protein [Dyadobacter sp. CY312]
MTKPHTDRPDPDQPGNMLSRRTFFINSGVGMLSAAFLSSCNIIDDIFPGKTEKDKTLAFFGDSLTIGAGGTAPYGTIVAAALSNRPVLSDGIVGQVASRIAVRQGGVPLTISIEGGKLDSIKPIRITKLSNLFLSTPTNSNEYSRTGSVNGVRCTIRRVVNGDESETYTIAPATVSVMEVPADTPFILEDAERLKSATQILWYGRNNIGSGNAETDIIAALESSVAYINAPARYIVVGVLISSVEGKGTANFAQVASINEKLAAKYGKAFVEMTPPTESEMAEIGYVPTENDIKDLANLNFPRGMRSDVNSDDIHLNDKGYKIVANRVIAKLKELKY